jgi:hypothetical protein
MVRSPTTMDLVLRGARGKVVIIYLKFFGSSRR